MKRSLFVFTVLAVFAGSSAAAQVSTGYPPERSPYRDLEYHHEATLFGGYFRPSADPAGVAPRGGGLAGIRYEVVVGGPAQLVVRLAEAFTERNVINPTEPAATRSLGVRSWPVYLADAGISLNLTGQRSFRGIVPVIYTGLGIATDAGKKVDEDPYRLGTTFAISVAGGLRFVPGGRLQIRADVGTYMYQIKYPSQYYVLTSDNTSVLDADQAKNFWKRNGAFTLGVSYLLFR
ncbi:MAG: hypothetical protein M3O61_07995 [Gemmatimonadota bacterium]|nr:hypothetical protein [Gemmatimonadota bacterium]